MRLPSGVNVYCEWNYLDGERGNDSGILLDIDLLKDTILFKRSSGKCTRIPFNRIDGVVKPYLRSMSTMTEKERKEATQFEIINLGPIGFNWDLLVSNSSELVDWLIAHHFDFRGLIKLGLALEAKEGMYE